MDRESFAARQAAMTSNWFEGVKAREADVEGYIAKRRQAYLDRWKEASRFICAGDRILDLGGGNLYAALIEYLTSICVDYWYLDVDKAAVEASRALATSLGFKGNQFSSGFNDKLAYPDESFDAIFSSHCIEHSFNLSETLQELNRVLRTGGHVLMAVPVGWEENPEHPYFLGPNHWISLINDFGFQIRVAEIGREYPESGYDLFIAARKVSLPKTRTRISPVDFRKDSFLFKAHRDSCIAYTGDVSAATGADATHLRGDNWTISICIPGAHAIAPIFTNHDWSGIIRVRYQGGEFDHDLFSWFTTVQPLTTHLTELGLLSDQLRIRSAGRNPASWSTEAVLHGVLYR